MLDNPSLLLARSFSFEGGNELASHQDILVANFSEDKYCLELANSFDDKQFTAFTYNFAAFQSLKNAPDNLNVVCDHQLKTQTKFDCAVIYFPKSKSEFEFLINNLFNHVKADAPIYVVGDNKGGVKTCEKMLKTFCSISKKVDAAKHCALFLTTLIDPSKPFIFEDWYKHYQIQINGVELTVYTLPGVFSHGELDMGTRLLLENIQKPKAKILDFGCGAGLIGAYLSKINENVTITGLDVSALAIESTLKTYQANGVINGKVLLSNGLSEVKAAYNQVYSNPPFHSGVKTNYAITELFLNTIKEYIYPHGSLTLVANSFLKYQPLLEKHFGHFDSLSKNRRFNVYHATKGRN
jgi:16S rRNA (guanine1207-N2)-methyltransferase